ncbi:MAG TPA: cytochrome c biogenesis protein CcdA [Candidatus Binataceae bacterium]|nr:cytochrome c biogenesis protein CcdA [Candidatus Binataceae bacterium]
MESREAWVARRASRRLTSISAAAVVVAAIALGAASAAMPVAGQIVEITRVSLTSRLVAGKTATLKIDALVATGWHINSDRPAGDFYIPTRVSVNAPGGITAGPVANPPAEMLAAEFSKDQKLSVFTGALHFEVPLTVPRDFNPSGAKPVTVTIDYQACNNVECLRPTSTSATADIASLEDGAAAAALDGAIAGAPRQAVTGASSEAVAGGAENNAIANVFAKHGWLIGFLAVLLGGLALNLTPCVYPLIGVTVAYFGNQGGGPRRVLMLAITYVLGITMMFSAAGVAVALSGGLFGAAMQSPLVLSALAMVLVGLALSNFGFFVLQPPQWMMRRAAAARPGFIGAFAMGLGMGVVAAPCIGPIVLGLLLMVERSQNALFGFALFFTLGIGLGIPYVGIALAAGSIRRLPRSGEWLAWIEQLFGFVLIGLAIYFLDPVVPRHLMMRFLPYYAAAAAIFLGFVTRAGRSWRPFLVLRSAVGAIAAAILIYASIPRRAPVQLTFQPFLSSALQAAQAGRKPVLIDFRADWCIPCREMDRSTFVDPAVVSEAQRFVRLRADLTRQDKNNATLMSRFGIQGVPTTMIIDSKGQVRLRKVGYVSAEELRADLRRAD